MRRPTAPAALTACALAAYTLAACTTADRNTAPGASTTARFALAASVQSTTATAVEVRASFGGGGSAVELARQTVPLTASASQEMPLTVDLARCLGAAATAAGACPVMLELSLMRDATLLDRQTVGPLAVTPGATVTVPTPVALHEVSTVRVSAAGGAARLEAGESLALTAAALDRAGGTLAGRVFQWESSNPAVLRVDAATGAATGVGPGTATARASGGGRTGQLELTVSQVSVRTLAVTPLPVQVDVGATQPLAVLARDARGNALAGRTFAFASSDPSVATVSSPGGVVTGVGPGAATVTVSSAEGPNGATVRADVPVTVRARQPLRYVGTLEALPWTRFGGAPHCSYEGRYRDVVMAVALTPGPGGQVAGTAASLTGVYEERAPNGCPTPLIQPNLNQFTLGAPSTVSANAAGVQAMQLAFTRTGGVPTVSADFSGTAAGDGSIPGTLRLRRVDGLGPLIDWVFTTPFTLRPAPNAQFTQLAVPSPNFTYDLPGVQYGGTTTLGGVPFMLLRSGSANAWHSNVATGPNPRVLTIPVGVSGVTRVHTLMNTWWGQSGPSTTSVTFVYADGTSVRRDLVGGRDIRDHLQNTFTNTIDATDQDGDGVSAREVARATVSGALWRLDMQTFVLPGGNEGKVLRSIVLSDSGAENVQRVFVLAATVETATGAGR